MAIADYSAFKTALDSGQTYTVLKNSVSSLDAARMASTFLHAPFGGSAPTTAAACSSSTTGHMLKTPEQTTFSGTRYLAQAEIRLSAGFSSQTVIFYDRLSHQGGLSGTTTGEQTTNLPTAALTRYTDGVGVFIGIEIHTTVGSTQTTLTANYTNQSGTTGRTTKAVLFGGSGFRQAHRFFILPLQDGDTGVLSVEGITLAASTVTAGAFGVVLFKPLLMIPQGGSTSSQARYHNGLLGGGGFLPEVKSDACICMLLHTEASTGGDTLGYLRTIDV